MSKYAFCEVTKSGHVVKETSTLEKAWNAASWFSEDGDTYDVFKVMEDGTRIHDARYKHGNLIEAM